MLERVEQVTPTPVKRLLKLALPPYKRLHCPVMRSRRSRVSPFRAGKAGECEVSHVRIIGETPVPVALFSETNRLFKDARKTMLQLHRKRCGSATLESGQPWYVTADLLAASAMVKVDITALPFWDNAFDVLYCSTMCWNMSLTIVRRCESVCVCLKPDGWVGKLWCL